MVNYLEKIKPFVAFRILPTTTIVVLVYAAVFISVLSTDELPGVPPRKWQHGLNLSEAYADLHQIAGIPHPYNSHHNDHVHNYVLDRVRHIACESSFVEFEDDISTNVTFANPDNVVYFEAKNVLVKVEGKEPELDGVLLSAHFDSVSTAPGVTDDGMGVASLIQVLEYFSRNQPKRTLVFNINDGEEDGLHGAHAFISHPWVNLTSNFVNLEGAGAGGRPLLLRASSVHVADAFSKVPHPHGSSMSADAFRRGVVKSGTDYSVYTAANLDGFDLAFYRRRSFYHTKDDSVPSLNGKAPLWNMAESTLFATLALANNEASGGKGVPVYFDLFGESLVVDSLTTFFIVNIVLLVVGPFLVAGLVFFAHRKGKLYWSAKCWGQTPVAIIVTSLFTFGLGLLFTFVNPFIVYSSPGTVLVATLSLSYISFVVVLRLFSHYRHTPQQRSNVLFELFVFWWIFLVVNTVVIGSSKVGGLYAITFFYSANLISLLIALLEHFELPAVALPSPNDDVHNGAEHGDDGAEASTERTPLLGRNGHVITKEEVDEDNQVGIWLLQFLVSVPFPVILVVQLGLLLIHSLNQTLADGSPASTVYLGISLISFLTFLPLIPFAHKLHQGVSYFMALVFAIALLYGAFAFPFSSDAPLKVFFQQSINLNSGDTLVQLTGVEPWLRRRIITELPSSWGKNLTCSTDALRPVPTCLWSGLLPHVAPGPFNSWVEVETTLNGPGKGRITVSGKNTRNCRLYFDSAKVTGISIHGSSGVFQREFPIPEGGTGEVRLWSRTWEKRFDVDVEWDSALPLAGRAACEWAEQGEIPALQEVLSFVPSWVRVTKRTDGLLEGWKTFSLE